MGAVKTDGVWAIWTGMIIMWQCYRNPAQKSKLLKPGGQFQDHDVLKGLCNGTHCMLLTFVSKITFLEIQGAPTSTLIWISLEEKENIQESSEKRLNDFFIV